MVKAMPSEAKGDIRNLPNAMAKIRKNVGKAKEVLSANEEYQVCWGQTGGGYDAVYLSTAYPCVLAGLR